MPQFNIGETKTAKVTLSNPKSKSFAYNVALILGLPEVARAEKSISIAANQRGGISLPDNICQPLSGHIWCIYLSRLVTVVLVYIGLPKMLP